MTMHEAREEKRAKFEMARDGILCRIKQELLATGKVEVAVTKVYSTPTLITHKAGGYTVTVTVDEKHNSTYWRSSYEPIIKVVTYLSGYDRSTRTYRVAADGTWNVQGVVAAVLAQTARAVEAKRRHDEQDALKAKARDVRAEGHAEARQVGVMEITDAGQSFRFDKQVDGTFRVTVDLGVTVKDVNALVHAMDAFKVLCGLGA